MYRRGVEHFRNLFGICLGYKASNGSHYTVSASTTGNQLLPVPGKKQLIVSAIQRDRQPVQVDRIHSTSYHFLTVATKRPMSVSIHALVNLFLSPNTATLAKYDPSPAEKAILHTHNKNIVQSTRKEHTNTHAPLVCELNQYSTMHKEQCVYKSFTEEINCQF